jgi:transposase
MSLHGRPIPPVPEETARVARATFPKGNTLLTLRDELGTIFSDQLFAHLYPTRGQPAEAPWRLALVTALQFVEQLSDRQAADAVRSRIDWKYALGLELTDPGFHHTVLCEFRARLIAGSAEERLLDAVIERCRERDWLKARGRQRTDSTHVLARARAINRLECVCETMRHAFNSLAVVVPEWLKSWTPPQWADRYGPRIEDFRLPIGVEQRHQHAEQVGRETPPAVVPPAAPGGALPGQLASDAAPPGPRGAYDVVPHPGVAMSPPPAAARHLLVLCGLIPLPEMTQDDVDYLFRRVVEDAQPDEPPLPSAGQLGA